MYQECLNTPTLLLEEYWVNVTDYEGLYQVSCTGKVRSLDHFGKCGRGYGLYKGKILKPEIDRSGYKVVRLSKKGVVKKFLVHRLVASSFLNNSENMPIVNHIDCDKQNNHYKNLEWCTPKQNVAHALKNELQRVRGSGNGNSKLKEKDVLKIRKLAGTYTLKELALIFKVDQTTISKILNGSLWGWLKEGDVSCV